MNDPKSPHKILKERELLRKSKNVRFTWKDIKDFRFEDNDIIEIAYDEGHVSENDSWDPHWYASVIRMIQESDSEYSKRIENLERDAAWARERRYQNYLKLKEEFENGKD